MLKYSQTTVLCLLMSASAAMAQKPAPPHIADSSIDRILALTSPPELGAVLRPVGRPRSRAKLDTLADRITARAIAAKASDGFDERFDAIATLRIAGGRPRPDRDGVPYEGAAERLIEIHKRSPAVAAARAAAVLALTDVVDFERSATYLQDVATSQDPTAKDAMAALIVVATPGSPTGVPDSDRQTAMNVLRALWIRLSSGLEPDSGISRHPGARESALRTIPDKEAAAVLWRFARNQGWTK